MVTVPRALSELVFRRVGSGADGPKDWHCLFTQSISLDGLAIAHVFCHGQRALLGEMVVNEEAPEAEH